MQITFLGSGSAFCIPPNNFQSNILLTSSSGKRLLIDCGGDIRLSLAVAGLSYTDIDDIYISHLHSDHVGGLEYMGFSTMFDNDCNKPGLYICESISAALWENCLSAGLSVIEDKRCELSDYFSVHAISDQGYFVWENIEFNLVATEHVGSKGHSMLSYGLFFCVNEKCIYLTTDTKLNIHNLQPYFEKADLIFHDCETLPKCHASGVHAHYSDLVNLAAAFKHKMWLYHYNDESLPDAIADGFCGFVQCGQSFEFPSTTV